MFKKQNKTNMELEIIEQSKIIPYILMKYINPETGEIKIDLPENITKIVLVASGSSYHCARFAVDLLEKFSKIESRAIYSSETPPLSGSCFLRDALLTAWRMRFLTQVSA